VLQKYYRYAKELVHFRYHYLAEFSPEALRRERGKVAWLSERPVKGQESASNPGYTAVNPDRNNR